MFFVTADDADGRVYNHFQAFKTQKDADGFADRIRAALPTWGGPVRNPSWVYFRTRYGSAAYARNAPRLEAETELAERSAELGDEAAYNSLPDVMKANLAAGER